MATPMRMPPVSAARRAAATVGCRVWNSVSRKCWPTRTRSNPSACASRTCSTVSRQRSAAGTPGGCWLVTNRPKRVVMGGSSYRSGGRTASFPPDHLLELGAGALALLEDALQAASLLPVASEGATVARVEEVEEREGALGVAALGLAELRQGRAAQVGRHGGEARAQPLDLGDRLLARGADGQVAVGLGRIVATKGVHEALLA